MDASPRKIQQRTVRLTVDLPVEVLVWIDGLKSQLGYRTRGQVMTSLLLKLIPKSEHNEGEKDARADEQ